MRPPSTSHPELDGSTFRSELDGPTRNLWLRHLAGEMLAGEDAAQLAALVRAGGPQGRAMVADETLHRTLVALGRAMADEAAFLKRVDAVTAHAHAVSADRFVAGVERRISERLRRPKRWPKVAVGAALLAAAGFALVLGTRTRGLDVTAGIGSLTLLSGTLVSGDHRIPTGGVAPEGVDLVADEGPACLRLGASDRLCLARSSRARLLRAGNGSQRVILTAGKAGATVVESALTMTVPGVQVVAHTASFAIDVGGEGDSIVSVLSGAVRIGSVEGQRVDAHRSFTLAGGARALDSQAELAAWALIKGHGAPDTSSAIAALARAQAMSDLPEPGSTDLPRCPPIAGGVLDLDTQSDGVAARNERLSGLHNERCIPGEGPRAVAVATRSRSSASSPADVGRLSELVEALHTRGRHSEANGIQARLSRQHPVGWTPPLPALYRIRAGGAAFMDPSGSLWAPDAFFEGGRTYKRSEAVRGTVMPQLYQTERNGSGGTKFSYEFPVATGRYVVYLHFAEIVESLGAPNRRRFDVLIEDQRVLDAFDIGAEVGSHAALIKSFVADVADGGLTIVFARRVENPKVSAIEIYPLPPGAPPPPRTTRLGLHAGNEAQGSEPVERATLAGSEVPLAKGGTSPAVGPSPLPPILLPPSDALYRINAGGDEYIDPEGRRWSADSYSNDVGRSVQDAIPIQGTELDRIYQSHRTGSTSPSNIAYAFPVSAGRYLLRLHFAETNGAIKVAGRRIFDVVVEGTEVLPDLDIAAAVGNGAALVKEIEVVVADGTLDVELRTIVHGARIAALEVLPLASPVADRAPALPAGGQPTSRSRNQDELAR